jgi:hypothetical protein
LPAKRIKRRKANPSPANLRSQNRRVEWLAFRFCAVVLRCCFTLLLSDYGKRSVFAANRPY